MRTLEERIDIDAPPAIVWGILDDFSGVATWAPYLRSSAPVGDQKTGVGSYRVMQHFWGFRLEESVIEWEEGRGLRVQGGEGALSHPGRPGVVADGLRPGARHGDHAGRVRHAPGSIGLCPGRRSRQPPGAPGNEGWSSRLEEVRGDGCRKVVASRERRRDRVDSGAFRGHHSEHRSSTRHPPEGRDGTQTRRHIRAGHGRVLAPHGRRRDRDAGTPEDLPCGPDRSLDRESPRTHRQRHRRRAAGRVRQRRGRGGMRGRDPACHAGPREGRLRGAEDPVPDRDQRRRHCRCRRMATSTARA